MTDSPEHDRPAPAPAAIPAPALAWQPEVAPGDEPPGRHLFRLRHSTSHIMAEAVLQLFPGATLSIGPPIENGFYYDFELPETLTPEHLDRIAAIMKKLIKRGGRFQRADMPREAARAYFEARGQRFKVDIIDRLAGDTVTLYRQNEFVDLCAGPHVADARECRHFKLQSVAGAHWRGQTDGPRLQRIYGTVWPTEERLTAYLEYLDEAKRRDHRRLGVDLDLLSFHPFAPGAPFYHPKGLRVLRELQAYWREVTERAGYVEIQNPVLYRKELFETSGHWEHFREHMFVFEDADGETYGLKPMNCPDTMLFFRSRRRSFRELPLRVSEGGLLHRNEVSGALSGLTRVRQFMQDDAHIFLREDMVQDEVAGLLDMVGRTYGLFKLDYDFTFSTRPAKAMGSVEAWQRAEASLRQALDRSGARYAIDEGGGAFYGPKIDIHVRDCLGRRWQCATVQLDFQVPERFDLKFTDTDNELKRPIVIHRAVFGSFERFFGILLEHTGGAFPTWLAPVQALVLPIKDPLNEHCHELRRTLRDAGIRAEVDDRSDKIGYKIREAEVHKVPYMLVVGERERDARVVSVRTHHGGQREAPMTWDAVRDEIAGKTARREFDVELKRFDTWLDVAGAAATADSQEY